MDEIELAVRAAFKSESQAGSAEAFRLAENYFLDQDCTCADGDPWCWYRLTDDEQIAQGLAYVRERLS
jgi:hypothetical protein